MEAQHRARYAAVELVAHQRMAEVRAAAAQLVALARSDEFEFDQVAARAIAGEDPPAEAAGVADFAQLLHRDLDRALMPAGEEEGRRALLSQTGRAAGEVELANAQSFAEAAAELGVGLPAVRGRRAAVTDLAERTPFEVRLMHGTLSMSDDRGTRLDRSPSSSWNPRQTRKLRRIPNEVAPRLDSLSKNGV